MACERTPGGPFQRANGLPGGSVVAVPTAPLTPYASRGLRFAPNENLQGQAGRFPLWGFALHPVCVAA